MSFFVYEDIYCSIVFLIKRVRTTNTPQAYLRLYSGGVPQTSPSLKLSIDTTTSVAISPGNLKKSNEKVNEELITTAATDPAVSDCGVAVEAPVEDNVNTSTQVSTNEAVHQQTTTERTGGNVFDLSSPSSGKSLPCVTQISSRADNDLTKVIVASCCVCKK